MQGAYVAAAGIDVINWSRCDPVLSLYVYAVAEQVHATRAEQQKQMEEN